MKICKNCGKELVDVMDICPGCGHREHEPIEGENQ